MRYLKGILFASLLTLTACASLSGLSTSRSEIAALHQGMTEREVVNKIGRPIDINRSRGEYGTTAERWIRGTWARSVRGGKQAARL